MADQQVRYPLNPPSVPMQGRLLDVAAVEDRGDGIAWAAVDGIPWFESFEQMQFRHTIAMCAPSSKTFDNASNWVYPFWVVAYGGVKCQAVGQDRQNVMAKVEEAFEAGESTPVEAGLMDILFTNPAAPYSVPTDVTPAAGAVKPLVGVSILEEWMSTRYNGAPIVHTPPSVFGLLVGPKYVEPDGQVFKTKLGTRVVNGPGYSLANAGPTGTAHAAGEMWLYATGDVVVLRGKLGNQQQIDMADNNVYTLAERPFVVGVDGPVAGIKVQVAQ
jgi:hypothetical protein